METFNTLDAELECPRCGVLRGTEVEFTFGPLDQLRYRVGDRIDWGRGGLRWPPSPPPGGDHAGEGYAVCPACGGDYWVVVTVTAGVLTGVRPDPGRSGHLPGG